MYRRQFTETVTNYFVGCNRIRVGGLWVRGRRRLLGEHSWLDGGGEQLRQLREGGGRGGVTVGCCCCTGRLSGRRNGVCLGDVVAHLLMMLLLTLNHGGVRAFQGSARTIMYKHVNKAR